MNERIAGQIYSDLTELCTEVAVLIDVGEEYVYHDADDLRCKGFSLAFQPRIGVVHRRREPLSPVSNFYKVAKEPTAP